MSQTPQALAERLQTRFEGFDACISEDLGQVTLEILPCHYFEVCQVLRDEGDFSFELLMDLCGVDYSAYGRSDWKTGDTASSSGFSRGVEPNKYVSGEWRGSRFAVVAHLLSIKNNQRLRLRVFAEDEPPRVSSVVEIWKSANWFEREAFDLFGILFEGHPDLRRILTDYGFVGHPLRKDFPQSGHVEMRYDAEKQRVVYEPVSIEPRVLAPRVLRDGMSAGQGDEKGEADNA